MTPAELLSSLRQTGTGADKINRATAWLGEHRSADTTALLVAMSQPGGWPEGTIKKAHQLLAGVSVEEVAAGSLPPGEAPSLPTAEEPPAPPGTPPEAGVSWQSPPLGGEAEEEHKRGRRGRN